ncbi:MAG: hybrid sensor histidine kinase/response regulator [Anaerolineae bacterium]
MGRSAKIREQLISSFRAELVEHVQTMTDGLLAIEQGRLPDEERQDTLETIFRAAHSLKGAARAVNVTVVEQLAHSLENILDAMQQGSIRLTPELFTACYRALDAIGTVQKAYEAGETTPPLDALISLADLDAFRKRPQPAMQAAPEAGSGLTTTSAGQPVEDKDQSRGVQDRSASAEETIRVNVSKLDTLMAQLSELLVTKMRAEQRLEQLHHLQQFVSDWQREWLSVRGLYTRLSHQKSKDNGFGKEISHLLHYLDTSQGRLDETNTLADKLIRQYTDDTLQMALAIDEIEDEIKRIRMLPLSTITGPFGRMVRDLAQEAGKEAVLNTKGLETELDKQVLEQIKDPLIHMLRNAIDHGIELPDAREAAGKMRSGTITLGASQEGQNVIIYVADDGAGLDTNALRQALSRQGLADAHALRKEELQELIFTARVSTSPIITDISGRGIGLTVVRRNVEALHGRVEVDSTSGQGATFTLNIPLTLTSARGLLVRVSDQTFVLPMSAIEHIQSVSPQDLLSVEGNEAIRYDGQPVTLVRLDDILDLPRSPRPAHAEDTPVVIISADRRLALAVDELSGEQEVVIKSLGKQLVRVAGLAGATVLGSGQVALILNTADLVKRAIQTGHRPIFEPVSESALASEQVKKQILVVDDSITTRTLEKNILEAAGYRVQLATDGQEALAAIATGGIPDLIVTDILMPRMTGFELTERIKSDERTADVPIILVSSLDSPADKTRGIEVGADAYIVKGKFEQGNLLETIQQLI